MAGRHILWDMGGTLLDTYPDVERTLAAVVSEHGSTVDPLTVAFLTRGGPGSSTAGAISELSARFAIPRRAFVGAYDALKRRWRDAPPPVMPGAGEVMGRVFRMGGLNLVVTHRDRASAEALVAARGLEVDDLICAPDGYPRKPDPAMYAAMLERHHLDPADCLAVGDRDVDVAASLAAGIASLRFIVPALPAPAVPHGTFIGDLTEVLPFLG
ncbi:HAD-IA family hydrolase [Pseudactinotalea sp. HY158]|uniref:HAD-IA family hydrolase n=1 Tax=Pseudactinotalea sp. HY158 TaxID=2654547 RepID=UPI001E37630C|nr:HAD-IA family hydrolase [Pseudactinotalea sp. HY158]